MSIRARLLILCLALALLPAIPVSLVVSGLIERSFEVGLSRSVSDALESGMAVSRAHLEALRGEFMKDAVAIAEGEYGRAPQRDDDGSSEGIITTDGGGFWRPADETIPPAFAPFVHGEGFSAVASGKRFAEREPSPVGGGVLRFFEAEDRTVMIALIPGGGGSAARLFWRETDPRFLEDAGRIVGTAQGFAGLRALEGRLRRSFFLSFLIIYTAVAALTFLAALALSERLARPIRLLSAATAQVAGGDWTVRVDEGGGGEIGGLARGFNEMVARLDGQRRRLSDLEKMAAWREFARHLAHEIKNPLMPIRLTVEEMRDRYAGDDGAFRAQLIESARIVGEELEHLQRLVREFSDFARMPGLAPQTASLPALARDVAALYAQADIAIDDSKAPPDFPFDADTMRRVLTNLFENAIGVRPGGKRAAIEVAISSEGDGAVLTVTDDGPGIPDEDLGRIFEPYFTRRRGGTGLGLAMVKSIVLLHGGTIRAENRGGARFTITLPLAGPPAGNGKKE